MLENHTDPLLNADTSLNLALKYRPRSFNTVVGQQHIITILRQGIQNRNIPQQLLFTGGSGLGKTTLARILSAALLCEKSVLSRDRGDACGECSSCVDITTLGRNHPDVVEIDAASNGGKDEIREIANKAQLVPSRGVLKVYIIDEVHGLSGPGGQAFLKLLEEPPAHVVFMLCTTDPEKMLKTNRGRCLELEMTRPSESEIVSNLKRVCEAEGWPIPDNILLDIVKATDKDLGVRGTLMTLGKVSSAITPEKIDIERLYGILGLPTKSSLNAIFGAVDSGDALSAIDQYVKLRERSSCKVAHAGLLNYARERWLKTEDSSKSERLFRHYKLIAETKIEDSYIEITIAKMTRPDSDNITEIDILTLTDEAKKTLTDLITTINESKTQILSIQEALKVIKYENENLNSAKTAKKPRNVNKAKNHGVLELPLSPELKESQSLSALTAKIIAAASPTTPDFKAFLSRCHVVLEDDVLRISAPNSLKSAMALHSSTLEKAASRLGYDVDITE